MLPAVVAQGARRRRTLAERRGGIAAAASAEDAVAAFLIAADTTSVLESFRTLLGATGIPANAGRGMLEALRQRLLPSLKWRQAQLINKLHERRTSGEYAAAAEAVRHGRPVLRALVMGGGPIGLRCAVELALLGHSVLALEQRTAFTRLNVLHLWDWVSHDLAELGIKSARGLRPATTRTWAPRRTPSSRSRCRWGR